MNTTNCYLEDLKSYFRAFYENGFLTQPEIFNMLQCYCDYLLDKNDIDPNSLYIRIHYERGVSGDYKYLNPDSKKEKFLNQFHAKEKRPKIQGKGNTSFCIHTKSKQPKSKRLLTGQATGYYAFCVPSYKYNYVYDIFLTKATTSISSLEDDKNLYLLLTDFAHEIQHIIQAELYINKVYHKTSHDNHICNKLIECLKNGTSSQKKLVMRLYERFIQFQEALSMFEYYADKNSFENLKEVLAYIINSETDLDYIQFISRLYMKIEFEEQDFFRQKELVKKRFEDFEKSIPDNPFLTLDDLYII